MNFTILKEIFNDWELQGEKVLVKRDLLKALTFVNENYGFDVLKSITAIDLKELGIELIYNLYSTVNSEELFISIVVNNEAESVSSLYDSAVADEKEIYDLFGVKFLGNKELTRLYMPEGWMGHPLRKDYKEDDERLKWNDKT